MKVLVDQLYLTLCNPMDCSPPGSSVHGIFPGIYSELHRDVVVLNAFNGDTLFAYSGPCYFNTHEHSNDVSIIYSVNGRKLKADFVGAGFIFKAVEK